MPQPLGDNAEPVLVQHVRETWEGEQFSFHMPGHKGGSGAPLSAIDLIGENAYRADLSEMGGFDYLHGASGALIAAQQRAAEIFGADKTWYLVNGATAANLAAILGTVTEGEEIVVARASHRSVYAGLVLSGARPIYLPPVRNAPLDGLFGVDVADLETHLAVATDVKAIHVTSPSYYGFTIDLDAIKQCTDRHNVALIVDEAHGTHWQFSNALPESALSLHADLVVHSPHKTLGSLTQSSLLHQIGNRVDSGRISGYLQMLQSSSPSALLLVSLDAAVAEMERHGAELWERTVRVADHARAAIAEIDGIQIYGDDVVNTPGIASFDPTKLVIDVAALGTTGYAASDWLRSNQRIHPEFSDLRRMVYTITPADSETSVGLLIAALRALSRASIATALAASAISAWPTEIPEMVLTPRAGSLAPHVDVAIEHAAGRICAEMVIPYPPGVPLLVPGELIGDATIDALQQLRAAGARIVGMSNQTAATIRCTAS